MSLHPVLLVLHILSAVIWLSFLPADILFRQSIARSTGSNGEKDILLLYLKFADWTGRIGLTGIIISGILLILILPYYGFFNFSANHWLASKQVITVVIILIVAIFLIPVTKQLKSGLESGSLASDNIIKIYRKLTSVLLITNILVLINFLFAITHRFFG